MKAFLIVAALLSASALSAQSSASTMMKSSGSSPDASMMKAEASVVSGYDITGMAPKVVAYTTEKDARAQASSKTVVYFFAAGWCPTCQDAYKNIKADFRSLPEDFVLVFVDYDKAKDLKQKYNIGYQHTFVAIGPGGAQKNIWSGSRTIAEIVRGAKAR